jgi:hypothetical protein
MHAMPRFGLKDLVFATALIAAGLATICVLFATKPPGAIWPKLGVPFVVGSALIGGGVFIPFKKLLIGALLGTFVGFVVQTVIGINIIMRM